MKIKILFLGLLLIAAAAARGQVYKLTGVVMNDKKEPLPLASVEIKELRIGSISKDDGSFSFSLERGQYDLVVSLIGYKTRVTTIFVTDADVQQNVVMLIDDSSSLGEVVVKARIRDRADEIIRNVIQNKDAILHAAGAYSCNVYIKASRQDSATERKRESDTDTLPAQPDFSKMSLAEILLHLDRSAGGQIREEKIAVNKRGDPESLFFLSTTDGEFNIYNNQIKAPALSEIPFVSPLSYSGLLAYRFKTIKTDRKAHPRVYTIAVRPRLLSNATIEGELTIVDSLWVVIKAEFRLPAAHLPEYDYFEVKQEYGKVHDSAWMVTRQQFDYYTRTKGGRRYGETTAIYTDFDFGKTFRKGHFGNEVSTTAVEAYGKDTIFWNRVRLEPLSTQQALYARYQDSLYQVMRSESYLDSMDRVLNRVTWSKLLIFGPVISDHKKQRTWVLPPVTALIQPIAFGGPRARVAGALRKIFPSKRRLEFESDVSYGFRNKDFNGTFSVMHMYKPFSHGQIKLKAGRNFDFIYPGDAWLNVLKRSNIYLNNSLELKHEVEVANGIGIYNTFEVAMRRSVANYKLSNSADTILGIPNTPPLNFEPYNAAYADIEIYLTPALKYIREPHEKIDLGSRWPTFRVMWRKGIPGLFNSKIDFDYWELGFFQNLKMGVVGNTSYEVKSGDFVNTRDLRYIDYRFQRQGDPFLFKDPRRTFQALDSTFPTFNRFYQGNWVHEFNGYLINKIPFFKKLRLQEVAGAGALIAPEKDLRYFEMFAGLERVFEWPLNPLAKVKLGIYVVGSVANKFNNPVQFKVGITTWDRFKNKWR